MSLSSELQNQLNELSTISQKIEIESQIIEWNQLLISITIDKSLINIENLQLLDKIRFVLLIKQTYPITPPNLYCITRFCIPELCDCRDLLEDTLQMKWDSENCFLKLIISQIPSFIQRYLLYYNFNNNNKDNNNYIFEKRKFFGKYYLDSIYEFTIIKYIPYLYFDVISEVVGNDENSMNIEDRKILITDDFVLLFCNKSLYELDQLRLVFVGPITSLIYIRQFINDGIVLLKWITKGKEIGQNYCFTMQLRTPDGDYIVDTLIDNLSKRSIKFKVTNRVNGNIKREGSVPFVEINLVEEEIKHLEKKIENKEDITKESISVLVNLYEKAIQYYSALNDEKFKLYINRLHEIYSNNEYTSLLNMKTIIKANNMYNVGHFKRKRKSKSDNDNNNGDKGEGKKKKEKKIKKKNDKDNNNLNKEKKNNEKQEDKKEENINNIINNIEEKDNDANKKNLKIESNNYLKDHFINNNIINEENINKKEIKESKPKKNIRKRDENNKLIKNEMNKNNNIQNSKNQRMFIDKKEIEEMIKNEININNKKIEKIEENNKEQINYTKKVTSINENDEKKEYK